MAEYLRTVYRISERRACGAASFARSTHRYRSVADPRAALRIRLKELATSRVRFGYRRLHILLQREGWRVNHKRVYRLYTEECLSIRTKKPRRHRSARNRVGRAVPQVNNECWSMDFMSDQLFDGRRIRVLTIVDCHSRESLATEARFSFRAAHVVEVLSRLVKRRGAPKTIRCDNGPEFVSRTTGSVGLLEQSRTGLLPAWEAHGQCLYRVVQRQAPGRVPEHYLVPIPC